MPSSYGIREVGVLCFAVTLLPVPADELRLVITKTALRMSWGAIFLRKIKTAEASLLWHTVLFFPCGTMDVSLTPMLRRG